MKKVKAGLANILVLDLIIKANFIVLKMTGNLTYPTPNPTLLTVQQKADDLAAAVGEAESGDHAKVALKNQLAADLKLLVTQLAAYVQNVSAGDELKILSAGYEVTKPREPVGPLEAVEGLGAKTTDFMGQIDLSWKPVQGKDLYVIEMNSADPNNQAEWKQIGFSTKTKFSKTGLESGGIYWFRVAAVGAAGKGPYSDPARGVAS